MHTDNFSLEIIQNRGYFLRKRIQMQAETILLILFTILM
jgi:hypothetical protein